MKKALLILVISTLSITSCDQISNDKDQAILTVNYYNLIVDYDTKTSNIIDNFVNSSLPLFNEMVEKKRKVNNRINWLNFKDLHIRVESMLNNVKVSILEPKAFLNEETAEKVAPSIQGMHDSYEATKKAFFDFKNYYDTDEYKNDDWAKGATLTQIMQNNVLSFYKNRGDIFTTLEPIVVAAEEVALTGHPLKTEITEVKKTLKLVEKAIIIAGDENVDMNALAELSKKIETRIKESKEMSVSNLKDLKKDYEFKSFYSVTEWFSDDLKKAIKNKKVNNYQNLSSNYSQIIQRYNAFVE